MTLTRTQSLASTESFRRYLAASEVAAEVIEQIDPADWNRPTPNDEWDLRALVRHVAEEHVWAIYLLSGYSLLLAGVAVERQMNDDDLPGVYRSGLAQAAHAAVHASAADRVETSVGSISATDYLDEMCADQLIHAWDIATALGHAITLPPELVAWCAAWFENQAAQWRAAGLVGPPPVVADDASPQTRLLAEFGRTA